MGLLGQGVNYGLSAATGALPKGLTPDIKRWRRTGRFVTFDFSRAAWKRFKPLAAVYSAFMYAGPYKITVPIDMAELAWSIFAKGGK